MFVLVSDTAPFVGLAVESPGSNLNVLRQRCRERDTGRGQAVTIDLGSEEYGFGLLVKVLNLSIDARVRLAS